MAIPLINGINYSSANITVILPIIGPLTGVVSIEYDTEQNISDNYALGQDPVSRGYGQNTYTGSITIYKEIWNRIIDLSPFRDPLKLPPFDITITFGGAGVPFRKETLRACNFKKNPMKVGAGDTKLECVIPLAIALIER